MRVLLLAFILSACSYGQVTVGLSTPAPSAPNVSASVVGNPGNAQYNYWVIANYPGGSVISNTALVQFAPVTLTGSNYIQINWNMLTGASAYDVVKLLAPAQFSGSCVSCLVASGLTVASTQDTGSVLSSYTASASAVQANGQIYINTRDYRPPQMRQVVNGIDEPVGGGGFPKVVAIVSLTGQTAGQIITLLDANHPTGDFVLNDVLSIPVLDTATDFFYTLSWLSDIGPLTLTADTGVGSNSAEFLSPFSLASLGSGSQAMMGLAWPQIIRALTGQAVTITFLLTPTGVGAAIVGVNQFWRGTGYAPGATGTVTGGDGTATYVVDTVDGNGGVLTATVTGGTGYPDLGEGSTSVTTGGGNGEFCVIFTAVAGVIQSGVPETSGGFGYAPGDTGKITGSADNAEYVVNTVNANGAVLTFTVTSPGNGYTVAQQLATSVDTGSGDARFQVDITALAASTLVYNYNATLTRNQ